MNSKGVLVLGMLVGCASGAVMGSYAQHPAQPVAPPGARRWQQI